MRKKLMNLTFHLASLYKKKAFTKGHKRELKQYQVAIKTTVQTLQHPFFG